MPSNVSIGTSHFQLKMRGAYANVARHFLRPYPQIEFGLDRFYT